MKIRDFRFGPGHPPIIVAECGINDGGSEQRARALIDAAAQAGAHAVKWQQHHPSESTDPQPWMAYDTAALACGYAHGKGLAFGCTPFSVVALEAIAKLDLDWIKLGSGELSNHALVEAAATAAQRKGIPLVLSSGMHTTSEVHAAVEVARRSCTRVAVLECSSVYPALPSHVRLRRMTQLGCSVYGLSDHTVGIGASVAAIALGASMIERHFTVSHSWGGPDQHASLLPEQMRALVNACAEAWQAMQTPDAVLTEEVPVASWALSSIYAAQDIAPGAELTAGNIVARRPHNMMGIGGNQWHGVVGNVASRPIRAGDAIRVTDIRWP